VFGVSSIIGPVVGGFLVDHASWRWVFYLNLPPGILAAALMIWAWRDVSPRLPVRVDYIGALLLATGVMALLMALFQLNTGQGFGGHAFWLLLMLSLVSLGGLIWMEGKAESPIVPLSLLRQKLFSTATAHGFFSGFCLFGSAAFIPFFAQAVLGTSATAAGATLTPQVIGWVAASVIGSRLLLHFSYRSLAIAGMSCLLSGSLLMTRVGSGTPHWALVVYVGLTGIGMGLSIPAFLITVQATVPRQLLGTATATLQFARNIGGAVGVGIMGVVLASELNSAFLKAGLDPQTIALGSLLDPAARGAAAGSLAPIRESLAGSVRSAFVVALVAAAVGWVVTALAPRGRLGMHRPGTEAVSPSEDGPRNPPNPI
jgi:MFS family permease